jgi:hypothetical protein
MIRDASETWFNPTSRFEIINRVMMITVGMRLATTIPVLMPRNNSMTNSTTMTVWSRFPIKSITDSCTTISWEAIRMISMPMGYICW